MVKKRLTQQQEFEIMKLVLDKFLWIGFAIMAYGIWLGVDGGMNAITNALAWFGAGAVILLIFVFLIVHEYEIIK